MGKRNLAKKPQSLAGAVRERLADFERRLAIGIRQEVFLAELNADGHNTKIGNLRNEICNARKKAKMREDGLGLPEKPEHETEHMQGNVEIESLPHEIISSRFLHPKEMEEKSRKYFGTSPSDFNINDLMKKEKK